MEKKRLDWVDDSLKQALLKALTLNQQDELDKCVNNMHQGRMIMLDAIKKQLDNSLIKN